MVESPKKGSEVAVTEEERQKAIQSILWKRAYRRSEKIRAYMHKWREEHADEVRDYIREWNAEHREYMAERNRRYRQEHAAEIAFWTRRYHQEHATETAEYHRLYSLLHPEVARSAHRRRRARLKGANGHFTVEEFGLLCKAFENRCAYCSKEVPLVPDHAIPLAKGGSDNIDNVVPACAPCNNRKQDKTYTEYMEVLNAEAS